MGEAFATLRPHVRPEHVVFDVGSVKVAPAAMLTATFGAAVPWVATHPLFGPVNLARGERPLRTVVCPNALHPDAVKRVVALFEGIGCVVHLEDADAHDQSMALTHGLAFFVAKGMLDAGAPPHLAYAPQSFQGGLTRTIDAIRGDAGHLFVALHRENPYTADARRNLLRALEAIDRGLANPAPNHDANASLSIPDLGACSPDLRETREHDQRPRVVSAPSPAGPALQARRSCQSGYGRRRA